ncbi:MAG: class II fructose-bisphosphatase, partial [Anaerolineales bacterium]
MNPGEPTRNLALELVRVTEAAALAAGRFMGRGDKEAADQAAVNGMRTVLQTVGMDGVIVIGEGEKDNAPMLYNGEHVGNGSPPAMDVAVDPIDGTRPVAMGRTNSLATVAIAPRGSMFDPGPFVYMNKLAVGPEAVGKIDIEKPLIENLKAIAKAKGKEVTDLTTVILDRPRHDDMIAEIRKTGARIRIIPDGDVAAALMTAWPDSGIDVLIGIGGTPEGVLAACALRAMGGEIQGKLYARDADEL